MIAPKTHGKWREVVLHPENYAFKGLATRMLLTRVRLMDPASSAAKTELAINTIYDFFAKNEAIAKEDLQQIFG